MDALLTKFVQGDDEAKEALKANPFEENHEMFGNWGDSVHRVALTIPWIGGSVRNPNHHQTNN